MKGLVQRSVKIPDGQAQVLSFDGLERPLYIKKKKKKSFEVRIISKLPFPVPYFGRIDTW
jgi:hypothetical protein